MDFRIATIVLGVILIGMISFKAVKKRTTYKKLRNYLAREQYDEFFKLIDAPLTNALYPDYNINYFKLNAYLLKEDYEKANETLELLLRYPLKHQQRVDLVRKAFNIYVGESKRQQAKEMLDEILNWEGDEYKPYKRDAMLSYDIMILKKSNHIGELEALLDKTSGPQRGRLEYFIAVQYENAKNIEKRDEYLKRAAEDGFVHSAH